MGGAMVVSGGKKRSNVLSDPWVDAQTEQVWQEWKIGAERRCRAEVASPDLSSLVGWKRWCGSDLQSQSLCFLHPPHPPSYPHKRNRIYVGRGLQWRMGPGPRLSAFRSKGKVDRLGLDRNAKWILGCPDIVPTSPPSLSPSPPPSIPYIAIPPRFRSKAKIIGCSDIVPATPASLSPFSAVVHPIAIPPRRIPLHVRNNARPPRRRKLLSLSNPMHKTALSAALNADKAVQFPPPPLFPYHTTTVTIGPPVSGRHVACILDKWSPHARL
ncbi:hypothetical protein FB45DRAFT_875726 [Roridomyces roridus]|uniref:Uncharacterized protein n=1 Tax=Roridomyces roridus TaxID=1738132 RepID=A0AAD7FBN1_9AGAR|nr:hypothetical protein FB45DRAFT_875726 [Roridomyces roridus]